jgi:signal transduction histidine kinase
VDLAPILLLVSVVTNLTLGVFVLSINARSRAGRAFFAISSFVSIWAVSNYLTEHAARLEVSILFNRIAFVAAFLAVLSGVLFTYFFPYNRILRSSMRWLALVGSCVLGIFFATDWIVGKVALAAGGGYEFKQGPLVFFYMVTILVLLGIIVRNLLYVGQRGSKQQRLQARLVLFGFSAATVLGLMTNLFIPLLFESWQSAKFGPSLTIVLVGAITYAMVKHGLFDFRAVVARSLGYLVALASFAAIYGFLVFGFAQYVLDVYMPIWVEVVIASTTAMASLFFPVLKGAFDTLTNRLFYKNSYDPQALLDDLNAGMVREVQTEKLCQAAVTVLARHLKLDYVTIRLANGYFFASSKTSPDKATFSHIDHMLNGVSDGVVSTLRVGEDPELRELYAIMGSNHLAVAAELRDADNILGRIYFGIKRSGESFTLSDVRLAQIVADQIALALQNALKFEEIANFNATLQDKVKEANKEYELITQQMYAKNLKLAQINRTLTILRSIDVVTLESQGTLEDLSHDVASAIVQSSSYAFVAVLALNKQDDKFISFQGWETAEQYRQAARSSLLEAGIQKLSMSLDSGWLADADHAVIDVTHADNLSVKLDTSTKKILTEIQTKMNIPSMVAVKLRARDTVVGAMLVGFANVEHKEQDWELVERFGESVGISLDNKLLLDENLRAMRHLQDANTKMKQLDETKDEFISMASHQLRTPLTAVKGYISMVLDGDAGELNHMQRKLLDQAFVSSQRMVFLIADLLNISRLRTGKFVIEPSPTSLADIVESEVEQLRETAQSRGLRLAYAKPKNFPRLMLDETKIRQVVMNFLDNAIYYTPSGGHIEVHLRDKQQSVEFTVVDDGIGVPKHEQPHLFSKFYRAGNARKARPDGTGLGLFMAKKVVVAQHGAIIFKSKEGTGSTFGFTFAKAKLQSQPSDTQTK